MNNVEGRRPLKVREVGWAKAFAGWLSGKDIHPNQISMASVGFSLISALSLVAVSAVESSWRSWLLVAAAVMIQGRLLCNLFDGMVAVEGGKSTASGELFNDIPDRISDPLILIAAGYAIGGYEWASALGWAAGLLAIMTAYVRTLATSIGAPVDFRGPMAKQHRMAVMTIACVATAFEPTSWPQGATLLSALCLVVVGSLWTLYRRIFAAYDFLESAARDVE